jgi:hypothetical protein
VRQDVRQDVPVPEAEAPDQHRADVHLLEPCAWDASDDARLDATDAADLRREPSGVGAEKLAAPELDVRARDAWWFPPALQSALRARPDEEAELCIPDAVRSAEQSCAAQAVAAAQKPQSDEAVLPAPVVRSMRKSKEMLAQAAQQSRAEPEQPRDAEGSLQTAQRE